MPSTFDFFTCAAAMKELAVTAAISKSTRFISISVRY
jgi:hypothetical protein